MQDVILKVDTDKYLKNFLDAQGKLKAYPAKRKLVIAYLYRLYYLFDVNRSYNEKEVNELIKAQQLFEDYCTARRELVDYGFLKRTDDCRLYCASATPPSPLRFGLE